MVDASLLIVAGLTFVAGGIHRITGMGFALVTTPGLVLLYGPSEGVRLCIVLSMAAAIVMLATMWKQVQWSKAWSLIWPGLIAAPLGAAVAFFSPEPALLVLVAIAAILSLIAPQLSMVTSRIYGRVGSMVAGSTSGFLHITSGLSGPPLVSYADNERWSRVSFIATVQVVFMAFHIATLSLRGMPEIVFPDFWYLMGVLAFGLGAGAAAGRAITARAARWGMFAVAWVGSLAVLARGVFMVVTGE